MTLIKWLEKWVEDGGREIGSLAITELHQVVYQAIAEEREACAKLCEEQQDLAGADGIGMPCVNLGQICAVTIRERK